MSKRKLPAPPDRAPAPTPATQPARVLLAAGAVASIPVTAAAGGPWWTQAGALAVTVTLVIRIIWSAFPLDPPPR